jgi:hypothetical protein
MGKRRKSLSTRDRFEIFKRDRFTCHYCGGKPPEVVLHVDHIMPVAEGGSNDPDNLVTSCRDCNQGKGAVPLDHVRSAVTRATLDELHEQRNQMEAYQAFLQEERSRREGHADLVLHQLRSVVGRDADAKQRAQVLQFLKQLPAAEVMDAVDALALKGDSLYGDPWRYFCGICWTKIKAGKRSEERSGTYRQDVN